MWFGCWESLCVLLVRSEEKRKGLRAFSLLPGKNQWPLQNPKRLSHHHQHWEHHLKSAQLKTLRYTHTHTVAFSFYFTRQCHYNSPPLTTCYSTTVIPPCHTNGCLFLRVWYNWTVQLHQVSNCLERNTITMFLLTVNIPTKCWLASF